MFDGKKKGVQTSEHGWFIVNYAGQTHPPNSLTIFILTILIRIMKQGIPRLQIRYLGIHPQRCVFWIAQFREIPMLVLLVD
jgi:hypothetical protein